MNNNTGFRPPKVHRAGPRSRKDEQEFGLAEGGYVICPDCQAVYFEKSWHHQIDEDKHITYPSELDKAVKFHVCPACDMLKKKEFEGEVVIKLINQSSEARTDVLNSIKNSDQQAREKDVLDRVLWQEEKEGGLHVYTSENQLAVRIGKKLHSSFPDSKLEIDHSKGEDLIRVYWEY